MTEVQQIKLSDIKPYPKNPRKNDESVDAVANSIRDFGFRAPIIVDKDGVIIAGHTRYKAAKKLKLDTVPVIYASDLTPEQVQAYRIADNSAGSNSTWDYDLLQEIMAEIGTSYDMSTYGLDIAEAYIETPAVLEDIEETTPPAPPKTASTTTGATYRLGDHILVCGDATDPKDMQRLIDAIGGPADMLMTDPPYNVAIEGGTEEHLTIENDDMDNGQFAEFLGASLSNATGAMKPGAPAYIWYAFWRIREFYDAAQSAGLKVSQNLIWVKNVFVLGHSDYQWRHEPCLYGWREGAQHYFVSDRTLTTVSEEPLDIETMTEKELRDTIKKILAETPTDTIKENKPTASRDHPTMKPTALLARMIYNSSRPGDIILDPFGGSGSTMMACEQLHRRCAMMELDPHYCDVIIDRWETYTGRKAEKVVS